MTSNQNPSIINQFENTGNVTKFEINTGNASSLDDSTNCQIEMIDKKCKKEESNSNNNATYLNTAVNKKTRS